VNAEAISTIAATMLIIGLLVDGAILATGAVLLVRSVRR
jgi:hypothetical protein